MMRSDRPRVMTPRRAEEPSIDDAALMRSAGGDLVLARELLHIFYRDVLPDAGTIAAETAPEARRRLAHRLKGAAVTIGASGLAQLAELLAAGPGEGDAEGAEALVAEARAVASEIESRIAGVSP